MFRHPGAECGRTQRYTLTERASQLAHHAIPQSPSPSRNRRRRRAFTLIEVVLAIGLTAIVVYLLSTAIELYLVNVEASRDARRDGAARPHAARSDRRRPGGRACCSAPPPGGGGGGSPGFGGSAAARGQPAAGNGGGAGGAGGGGATGGGRSGGAIQRGGMPSTGGGPPTAARRQLQGVFGTVDQLRIDRAAYANWERAAREIEAAGSRRRAPTCRSPCATSSSTTIA